MKLFKNTMERVFNMNNRNKCLLITTLILVGVALIVFFASLAISGYDFIAFFKSPTFVWICVILGLYGLGVAGLLIWEKIKRL